MLFRGSYVSDIRGSAGGITASRNRSGAYLRARVAPTQVDTGARAKAKARLATQAATWSALSIANRDLWDTTANVWTSVNSIGDVIKLSGFNWFVKANASLAVGGQAAVTVPAADIPSTSLLPPADLVYDVSAGSFTAGVDPTDPWAKIATGRLNVFMTPGQNPGRESPTGGFQYMASFVGNVVPITTITTAVLPFPLVLGRVYFTRFVAVDVFGRVSAAVTLRAVATA